MSGILRHSVMTLFASGLMSAAAAVHPASSNDSSAELAAGGLRLVYNAKIRMLSEDLYISPKQIRIRYVFQNTSDQDQTILVAFPLPALNMADLSESGSGIADYEVENFVRFKTVVDGRSVDVSVQHRAEIAGVDITDTIRRANIPFTPPGERFMAALRNITPEARDDLRGFGAIDWDSKWPRPAWTQKTTFYWKQTFPAGRETIVEHSYTPVTGGFFVSSQELKPFPEKNYRDRPQSEIDMARAAWSYDAYCMDKSLVRGIAKRSQTKDSGIMAIGKPVEYILKTGANWSGEIGHFRLVIDKVSPNNLVTLCMNDIKKTGKTTFEVTRKNYSPDGNLKILFLEFPDAQ